MTGCSNPKPCLVSEVKNSDDIVIYEYDKNNEVLKKIIVDTKTNRKDIKQYKREKNKTTIITNGIKSQIYLLDSKNRLKSYSYKSGAVWEYEYHYDDNGKLVEVVRERFYENDLFTTNYIKISYQNSNPTTIIDSCVIAQDHKNSGNGYITRYTMSYLDNRGLEHFNGSLSAVMTGYLHEFIFLGDKESSGMLPTRLISTITQKTDGEPSTRTEFKYRIDEEGRVSSFTTTYSDVDHKPETRMISIKYKCPG